MKGSPWWGQGNFWGPSAGLGKQRPCNLSHLCADKKKRKKKAEMKRWTADKRRAPREVSPTFLLGFQLLGPGSVFSSDSVEDEED